MKDLIERLRLESSVNSSHADLCRRAADELEKASPKPVKSCERCTHFASYGKHSLFGDCQRFPPIHLGKGEVGFPSVMKTKWCGEYCIVRTCQPRP